MSRGIETKFLAHFLPIQERLIGALPATDHFELWIPAKATLNLTPYKRKRMQDALVEFIAKIAPDLPTARVGIFITPLKNTTAPDVLFEFFVARVQRFGPLGKLSIKHMIEPTAENKRIDRIRRAYNKKLPKLLWWKNIGARTILILESDDEQITNQISVWKSPEIVESKTTLKPDEVFSLESKKDNNPWQLWPLRIDDRSYLNLEATSEFMTPFDPMTLTDITTSGKTSID